MVGHRFAKKETRERMIVGVILLKRERVAAEADGRGAKPDLEKVCCR